MQYKQPQQKDTHTNSPASTESEDSTNAPLLSPTRTLGKTTSSKIEITFGDKISTVTFSKKQLARKTIARKEPEPRGTLKPKWDDIENGTITNYSSHTKTLDTDNRKHTVIRESDLAIVLEPLPTHQKQTSQPKRLIHMVACKSLREHNRNQKKNKTILFRREETSTTETTSSDSRTKFLEGPHYIWRTRSIQPQKTCYNREK